MERASRKGDVHVMPNDDMHPSTAECWCIPTPYNVCMECGAEVDPDCWKCGGEGRYPMVDVVACVLWIHHDVVD